MVRGKQPGAHRSRSPARRRCGQSRKSITASGPRAAFGKRALGRFDAYQAVDGFGPQGWGDRHVSHAGPSTRGGRDQVRSR